MTVDTGADLMMIYVKFKKGQVSHTVELNKAMDRTMINADYDKKGVLVGVEIIVSKKDYKGK